uniref:DUF4939 domain-containing protein n=1 Tax=Monopterus albus TaxID=43700 RepID=A0A3Q3K8Z9_MONAL
MVQKAHFSSSYCSKRTQALQQQRQDLSTLTQQVSQLTSLLLSQHGHTAASAPPALLRSTSPRRDPPIPEPDVFDGSVDRCRGFLLQCRRVFDQQPHTFCTDKRISYVINRLRGKALTWAKAADTSGLLIGTTIHEFLDELHTVFSPPSHQGQAARELMTIRQGAHRVLDYSVDFRVLATEADSGPQPPGRGPVPVRGSLGTGPYKK